MMAATLASTCYVLVRECARVHGREVPACTRSLSPQITLVGIPPAQPLTQHVPDVLCRGACHWVGEADVECKDREMGCVWDVLTWTEVFCGLAC